jgi:hypothetical protein
MVGSNRGFPIILSELQEIKTSIYNGFAIIFHSYVKSPAGNSPNSVATSSTS